MTWKPDICLYHANCMDGFAAAWAIWRKFGDACQYIPASHGQPIDGDFAGNNILMVDFSLKRDAIVELAGVAASIVILDHHKSAEEELADFIADIGDDARAAGYTHLNADTVSFDGIKSLGLSPVLARFDMRKSGARLAWEFAHGNDGTLELIDHIEDRDLWRFNLMGTRELHAALKSCPLDFALWDMHATNISQLMNEGVAILRAERQILEGALANAYTMEIDGHQVPALNITGHFASEAGHELLNRNPDAPFAVVWWQGGESGLTHYSLRSEDHRLDVSEVAQSFGGGGHRNAAGFQVWAARPHICIKSHTVAKQD